MHKSYICYKPTFRFHRWNHASYSAFASLGKQITIGRLTTDVTDGLLRNQHIRVLALAPLVLDDTDEASPPDICNDIILNLLEETMATVSLRSTAHPAFTYYYICLITKSYLWAQPTDRIFIFYQNEKTFVVPLRLNVRIQRFCSRRFFVRESSEN